MSDSKRKLAAALVERNLWCIIEVIHHLDLPVEEEKRMVDGLAAAAHRALASLREAM